MEEKKTAFETYADRLNKHEKTGLKIQSGRLQNFLPRKFLSIQIKYFKKHPVR